MQKGGARTLLEAAQTMESGPRATGVFVRTIRQYPAASAAAWR